MPFVVQGGSVSSDVFVFVRPAGGDVTDPDTGTLTLLIKDPSGTALAGFPITYPVSGFVRLALGHFQYTWATASDLPTGTYSWLWNADLNSAPVPTATEEVEVLPSGSLSAGALMTVAQFREHVRSGLPDDAIQRLIDANTLSITERAGAIGTVTRTLYPRQDVFIFLDRPAASITSIVEFYNDPVGISGVTLDSTDYRLHDNGTVLERWGYGTHPADWWYRRVELVYVAADDTAERIRVLIKLVQLDLNREPGTSYLRVGDYIEQSRNEAYNDEREAILASLVPIALTFA